MKDDELDAVAVVMTVVPEDGTAEDGK